MLVSSSIFLAFLQETTNTVDNKIKNIADLLIICSVFKAMIMLNKYMGFFIPKSDLPKMFYVKDEPSITQTNGYIVLVNKFIEKYGLFPNKKHEEDQQIINDCNAKLIVKV